MFIESNLSHLVQKLITYNPHERIDARSALNHPYFKEIVEENEDKENCSGENVPSGYQVKEATNDVNALKDCTNDDSTKRLRCSNESEWNGDLKHP
jgi:serine/threonine protein kinase